MTRTPGSKTFADHCGPGRMSSGGQLFVKFKGKILTDCGFGTSGDESPILPSTLFPANCLSKPIVAIALLGLMERNGIDLGTQIGEILHPEVLRANDAPGWLQSTPLCVSDLLNHAAGLLIPSAFELLTVGEQRERQLIAAAPEPRHPGYSDYLAWWIAELILLQLSGVPADLYIRQEVLVPNDLAGDIILKIRDDELLDHQSRLGVWVGRPPRSVPFLSMLLPRFVKRFRPAFSGLVTMSGLGGFYSLVSETLQTGNTTISGFPSTEYLRDALRRNRGITYDRALQKTCDFAAGFVLDMHRELKVDVQANAIGHSGGYLPSFGLLDVTNDVIIAGYYNGMPATFGELEQHRSELVESIYEDLGLVAVADS